MNNTSNELTDLELRSLLKKKEVPVLSHDLSNTIMNQIYGMEAQRVGYLKYMNRSWLFIAVALLLSLFTMGTFSFIQAAFANYINQLLPGLYDYFSILMVTLIASLFLYQLNQLLSYRFKKVEIAS